MADRKVKLIIEVDDRDVENAEATLTKYGVSVKRASDSNAELGASMRGAVVEGNLLADVIEKGTEVMVHGAEAVFELVKGYAEYGESLEKAKQLTGFSIQELSALEMQNRKTGGSFDQVGEGLKNFTKLIGDANNGVKEADARMSRLGLDPVKAAKDLDAAFSSVLKKIVSIPDPVGQANASIDAFGESGYKLLPFIKSFNGDIEELIKKAKELGVQMSDSDVRAAAQFQEALSDVQERARGVGITFAKELMPVVKDVLDSINGWLHRNQGEVQGWAHNVSFALREIAANWERLKALKEGAEDLFSGPPADGDWTAKNARAAARQKIYDRANAFDRGEDPDKIGSLADLRKGDDTYIASPSLYGGYNQPGPGKAAKTPKAKKEHVLSPEAKSIIEHADSIGISPLDLATLLFYEGAGSLSTSTRGGKGNKYLGPMQMGPWEQQHYGIKAGMSFDKYLDQGMRFLTDRGVRPGDDLLTLYKAVNGGNVNVSENASDGNGTIRQHVERMIRDRRPQAQKLFDGFAADGKSVFGDVSKMLEQQSDRLTKEGRDQLTRSIADLWMKMGIIPDGKILNDITRLAVDEAKKQGVAQPGSADIVDRFRNAGPGHSPIDISTPDLSADINTRMTSTQAYLKAYRDGFDLTQRQLDLDERRKNFEDIIGVRLDDQNQSRKEANQDLLEQLAMLQKMDVVSEAETRALDEKVHISREIRDLQVEIMNAGKNDGLIVEAAHLRDILELRNRERDAIISINRSQLELSHAMEISNNQIRAGIYEHMAAQKTLNQGIVDGINGTYDAILQRMNEPLDKLNQKSKGLLSFITEPLKAMQAQSLNNIFTGVVDKLFPGMGSQMEKAKNPVVGELKDHTKLLEQIARNTGGMPSGYVPSGGAKGGIRGIIDTIFGRGRSGGNSGNAPGGTPWFNPNGGSNYAAVGNDDEYHEGGSGSPDGSGFLSNFKSMFGAKNNVLTGKDSKAAGYMAGIGSIAQMLGGFLGENRAGRTLQYAGMGAQLGANFGPWGAAIGAGVGAIFGLFGHHDDAEKKLKQAAQQQFGINVSDKSVLKQLVVLGEGMFGKGKVGANAVAVVGSEEGQNILRAYAQSTGQSSLQIDRLSYGDPNWSGNQFTQRFSGMGTIGGGGSRIFSTAAGSYGPVPSVGTPATANVLDRTLLAAVAESHYQVAEQLARLNVMPPGPLVRMGLEQDPDAAADAYDASFSNNGAIRQDQYSRLTGQAN